MLPQPKLPRKSAVWGSGPAQRGLSKCATRIYRSATATAQRFSPMPFSAPIDKDLSHRRNGICSSNVNTLSAVGDTETW